MLNNSTRIFIPCATCYLIFKRAVIFSKKFPNYKLHKTISNIKIGNELHLYFLTAGSYIRVEPAFCWMEFVK